MANYSTEEQTVIKQSFDFFDKDEDEILSYKEIEEAIVSLGGELKTKEKEEINEMSKHNSNNFSFDNLLFICDKYKIDIKGIHNKLLQAFQLFEFEKKGFVNSKSIQSLLSNDKISDKDINQIIREANPDSNGYINIEEFANELIGNDSYNNNTINKVITTSMSNTIET